jgi:restriction system protein
MTNEHQMWGIHGGRTGNADTLFLQGGCVALGWHLMGDLGKLPANLESFKNRVAEAYPDLKHGAVPVCAGQLLRFVHKAKSGDIVVYPSKSDRHIHIGRIEGDYEYNPKQEASYPNHRKVKWLKKDLARTDFSQGALHEIGAAMSFFAVKTYVGEFWAAIEGKHISVPLAQDETVILASAIEDQTSVYVLKKLAEELKGGSFEDFVAHLLKAMGYKTQQPKRGKGADGGVDITAHKDELCIEPPIIKVQVKSTEGKNGDKDVSALYGKLNPGEKALFITLGEFTAQAENFARGKSDLRLINGDELVKLIFQHYEKFDSHYKGILPLTRVYVPDPEEAEE